MIDRAPDYAIFAGDYNVVLNPLQDTRNYLHVNNPHAMNELNSQISSLNLIDIWRDLNPDAKTYTLGCPKIAKSLNFLQLSCI